MVRYYVGLTGSDSKEIEITPYTKVMFVLFENL